MKNTVWNQQQNMLVADNTRYSGLPGEIKQVQVVPADKKGLSTLQLNDGFCTELLPHRVGTKDEMIEEAEKYLSGEYRDSIFKVFK